jgi:hypothetical protein
LADARASRVSILAVRLSSPMSHPTFDIIMLLIYSSSFLSLLFPHQEVPKQSPLCGDGSTKTSNKCRLTADMEEDAMTTY